MLIATSPMFIPIRLDALHAVSGQYSFRMPRDRGLMPLNCRRLFMTAVVNWPLAFRERADEHLWAWNRLHGTQVRQPPGARFLANLKLRI